MWFTFLGALQCKMFVYKMLSAPKLTMNFYAIFTKPFIFAEC